MIMKIRILCCIMIFGAHSFSTIVAMNGQEITRTTEFEEKLIIALRDNNVKHVERTIELVAGTKAPGLQTAFWKQLQSASNKVTKDNIKNESTQILKDAINQSSKL